MAKELGRVTDVAALDAPRGPVARLSISVPVAWTSDRTTLTVDAPRLFTCERCQGGGCDSCDRSGALRGPEDERQIDLTLPAGVGAGTLVRIPRPFDDSPIEQLIVEVRLAPTASKGVRRVVSRTIATRPEHSPLPSALPLILFTLVLIIAIALLVVI